MTDSDVVWTVRAGRQGEREERLLKLGLIGGGWLELPSLADVASWDDLAQLFAASVPTASRKTAANYVGQLWSFIKRMQVGDLIVLPMKTTGTIAVGRLAGPYEYRGDLDADLRHVRRINWIATDVPRDAFDQDLLYSFGAFLTFGRVRRENAAARILAALEGKAAALQSTEVEVESAEAAPDINEIATEQIRRRISEQFAGHDLAQLVGDILKASSFSHVLVSPPGADLGVDILAGGGPLGFDGPRLAVQVKTGQAGVDELRALRGVMAHFGAEHGLLVAWKGFRGTARAEARTNFFGIRLWDAGDVLEALFDVYADLPDELRSRLPLRRTWTLVTSEDV